MGGSIVGTTQSYAQDDNLVVLPGFATVNAFANYEIAKGAVLSLGVNNALYIARAVNGRSAKLSLKYSF